MGVPWKGRGKRMDEAIDIVRGLTSGGFFEYHGEVFDLPAMKLTPVRPSRSRSSWAATVTRLRRAVRRGR